MHEALGTVKKGRGRSRRNSIFGLEKSNSLKVY
jgi:hypothetical protein